MEAVHIDESVCGVCECVYLWKYNCDVGARGHMSLCLPLRSPRSLGNGCEWRRARMEAGGRWYLFPNVTSLICSPFHSALDGIVTWCSFPNDIDARAAATWSVGRQKKRRTKSLTSAEDGAKNMFIETYFKRRYFAFFVYLIYGLR